MSGTYRHVSFFSLKTETLVKKKLRFNEENIRETLNPINKDYGYTILSGVKTPFPTHGDPVAAEELRRSLQECLDRANDGMIRNDNENDIDDEHYYGMDKTQTPENSMDSENEEIRQAEFIKKRKQFNQAEFIIAQQKLMSLVMPDPGPSIGNNWHIVDNNASSSTDPIALDLSALNDTSSGLQRSSTVNYQTIREIVKQMSQSTKHTNS